jgi:hypothetical protein
MLRLLKLLRLARINRLIQRYEEEFASLMTTFKLAKLIIIIIVIGHWLSCLFFGVGDSERVDGAVTHVFSAGLDSDGDLNVGWVQRQFGVQDGPSVGHCGLGQCYLQKYVTTFCQWAHCRRRRRRRRRYSCTRCSAGPQGHRPTACCMSGSQHSCP